MGIDKRLLDILCDPVSKTPVQLLSGKQLDFLNHAIQQGQVLKVSGEKQTTTLKAGLITRDAKVIYRIDDDIPVMLNDEGIGTTQWQDFPA